MLYYIDNSLVILVEEALLKLVPASVVGSREEAKQMVIDGVVGLMAVSRGSTLSLKLEALRSLDSLLSRYFLDLDVKLTSGVFYF